MTRNKLKLNDDKTEFLVMTSKFHQQKYKDHTVIQVGSTSIVAFFICLQFRFYVWLFFVNGEASKKICQSVFNQIRNVNSFRKTLSDDSAATIIHSLITSRLDNANALLYDINDNV